MKKFQKLDGGGESYVKEKLVCFNVDVDF